MSRYLGQHFLINKNKLRKIVEALELKNGDVVIEIGPGKGALTFPLLEKCGKSRCKIIAIEKDKELVKFLKEKFVQNKNVEIVEGDALKEVKAKINPPTGGQKSKIIKNLKVAGNIPYYITGYLFRILGELDNKPSLIVLLIQKEVAERVCAKPPKMNLLAASVQFWGEPKIIGNVSRKDFRPAPKVDSAIIKLAVRVRPAARRQTENYYKFIKALFKQPRKTIINNLRSTTNNLQLLKEKLESVGVNPQARPQDLSVERIRELAGFFNKLP